MANVVVLRVEAHVRQITLNRPDKLNAITFDLVGELHDALDEIAADQDCRVAIITGAGRAFCAGLDLTDWGTPPEPGAHRHAAVGVGGQEFLASLMLHVRDTPQVVIAAVNGAAFGGGLSLACACDLRLASDGARFCSAFIRTGLSGTDAGISYLLPQIVGAGPAFDLIVTGRDIDAYEAHRIGLVSHVVEQPALLDRARSTATAIAGYTRTGLTLTKEAFWHNVSAPSLASAIALENRNQRLAAQTAEVQEYMASYSSRHRKDATASDATP
jgi:enoyl-CoA hydratase